MKNKKIFLELDEQEEPLSVGWIRLRKKAPSHEVFFEINKLNSFTFKRTEDLKYKKFYFSKFEGYHSETDTQYIIISNKSAPQRQKSEESLFSQVEEIKYLLPKNKDFEYIIYAKDNIPDFSLILLPENISFPIEKISIPSQNELYKLIQYYE